jgi:citrate/tricarballylate utilization protein
MPQADPLREAERIMVICNACRYCEGYCAAFQAMERRIEFTDGDLRYLANLCHNCGECLYACQYAPPHEFAINVPRTLAEVRVRSYVSYAWPDALGTLFGRHGAGASLALCALMVAVTAALVWARGGFAPTAARADFYAVLPHGVMVTLFGSVFGFAVVAIGVGLVRAWRDGGKSPAEGPEPGAWAAAIRDALVLSNLKAHGDDCTHAGEEQRTAWRRRFHHFTFYGFLLCFASTTVAAGYHAAGWPAPYDYLSWPVVLGTAGGLGLLVGPAGLSWLRRHRDPALTHPDQQGLDDGFVLLLLLTSATGLALLGLRETAAMPALMVVHLGVVLALFLTLPYGKFVHGFYRLAALLRHAIESRHPGVGVGFDG